MHIRVAKSFFCVGVVLAWTCVARAVAPKDYVAIRILEPSDPRPVPDDPGGCRNLVAQDCVDVGPAYPAGISDAGDVFGHMETNHPHEHHWEQGIRWLRRDNYQGDFLGTPALDPDEWPCGVSNLLFELERESTEADNRAHGLHARWVSPEGIATGKANPGYYYIDIATGEMKVIGLGSGQKASGNKALIWEAISPSMSCSTDGTTLAVADADLVEPPFVHEAPVLQRFDDTTLRPHAINRFDVIVGGTSEGDPIRIMPTGENQWGEVMKMEEIGPSFVPGIALDLSNTDPGYAVGTSQGFAGIHGVIWNTDTGQIIQDLGINHLPHRINSTGNMVAGTLKDDVFAPNQPVIWWTEDEWQSFEVLPIADIMAVVPGGEHWADLSVHPGPRFPNDPNNLGWSSPIAVNEHGQLLVMASLREDAPVETLTAWPRAIATGQDCPSSRWLCGIPFILDTLALEVVVLKGDVNNDSIVDFLDITPFINAQSAEGDVDAFLLLTPGGCFLCADIDMDGAIDFLDITPFVNLLDQLTAAVPEPASAMLLILGLANLGRRRRVLGDGCRVSRVSGGNG